MLRTLFGHIAAVVFKTWQAESVVLIGVMVLLLIRSFVEVEILNPYIMGSFLMYFRFFKLARLPVTRTRWSPAFEPADAKAGQAAWPHRPAAAE
jgi:exopolysaccharide production protein ExoQ